MAKNLRVSYHLLVALSLILTTYGLVILFSTSQPLQNGMSLFRKQCIWLVISLGAFWICSHINLIKLKPKMVRIYPVLVIKGTKLEKELEEGEYNPLTVSQAVERCKELLYLFNKK